MDKLRSTLSPHHIFHLPSTSTLTPKIKETLLVSFQDDAHCFSLIPVLVGEIGLGKHGHKR